MSEMGVSPACTSMSAHRGKTDVLATEKLDGYIPVLRGSGTVRDCQAEIRGAIGWISGSLLTVPRRKPYGVDAVKVDFVWLPLQLPKPRAILSISACRGVSSSPTVPLRSVSR